MMISLITAWIAVICVILTAFKYFAKKNKTMNRIFRKIHIPMGVLLIAAGLVHGLLAVLAVEVFIFHMEPKAVSGEWIIFMCLALYLNFACMNNKIWDRRLKPDLKTNLSISVIAAVAVGALMAIGVWINYPGKPIGALAAGIITPVFVFVPCFFLLTISANKLKKDIQKEEAEEME